MNSSTTATLPHEETLWGHPKGLYVLFFTEMWERFSYYGMRALLTLYMYSEATKGGLGWEKEEALALYGWYTMAVYVASVPGGIIADRMWGQKRCVLIGGLLLCAGHGVMAIPTIWAFYLALALIVMGVGLLKPNISTMVGGLYGQGDPRRDKGFTIFYMGINVGAAASALIVGYVGETIGWHYGFGLAGIGMVLGQIMFQAGQKYLVTVGNFIPPSQQTAETNTKAPLTAIESDRVKVLLISFLIVVVFWGAFEQAGGLMSIYTDEKVNRNLGGFEIPASIFQSLNPIFIIIFGTVVANFWYRRLKAGKQASALFKMALGTIIMGLGFVFMVKASFESDPADKVGRAAESVIMESGDEDSVLKIREVATAARESAETAAEAAGKDEAAVEQAGQEAFDAAVAAEAVRFQAGAQTYLASLTVDEDEEKPDQAEVEAAIAEALHEVASADEDLKVKDAAAEAYKAGVGASAAMIWLILAYLFHTIGELCASPVALSFITKLAPLKYASMMMGVYFAMTGLGNKLAGLVGESVGDYSERTIFTAITVFTIAFGLLLLSFLKPLNRMTHGAEDEDDEAGGH